MDVRDTAIPAVKLLVPRRFPDQRGWFTESYNRRALRAAGIEIDFVQDNQSYSAQKGTIRGLHFQRPPAAQDKLVRVLRGAILDVAVDLRSGSPTYGRHVSVRLDAESGHQLLVPIGFAHGFCTLEPDTEVAYKVSDHYAPDQDGGLIWNDPDLGIAWPVTPEEALLSEKDKILPRLAELSSPF